MTEFLNRAIDHIIAIEGGYVNHKDDLGKKTKYGITEAVARQNGYQGDMKEMPLSLARDIYTRQYWTAPGFDKILPTSEAIAAEVLDTGVNMGPGPAGAFLQRALNAFSQNGELYPMLRVDGKIGPATISALQGYMRARGRSGGEAVLLKALNSLQGARYIELTEQRTQNAAFTFGWFSQRVSM
jgi:lysozyme family protein